MSYFLKPPNETLEQPVDLETIQFSSISASEYLLYLIYDS